MMAEGMVMSSSALSYRYVWHILLFTSQQIRKQKELEVDFAALNAYSLPTNLLPLVRTHTLPKQPPFEDQVLKTQKPIEPFHTIPIT